MQLLCLLWRKQARMAASQQRKVNIERKYVIVEGGMWVDIGAARIQFFVIYNILLRLWSCVSVSIVVCVYYVVRWCIYCPHSDTLAARQSTRYLLLRVDGNWLNKLR